VLMHDAKRCDNIPFMAEQERASRRNRRENILLLIKAIHRHFDVTRGGPKYMADVTPTSFTYISAIVNNDRGCGNELAEKIERAFRLPQEWLDHAHPDADLDELASKHVPSHPGARIGRRLPQKKPKSGTEVEQLRKLVEQLAAQVAEIKNSPK
jgi:hypothetical protein